MKKNITGYCLVLVFLFVGLFNSYCKPFQKSIEYYYNIGKYDSAILIFDIDGSGPSAYNIIAKCYLSNKKFQHAQQLFQKALTLNQGANYSSKQEFISHYELAKIYKDNALVSKLKDKLDLLENIYKQYPITELTPNLLLTKANYYNYIDRKKSYDLFVESINLFEKKNPELIQAYDKFLDFLLSEGNLKDAKFYLDQALGLVENNFNYLSLKYSEILLYKCLYYFNNENYNKAIAVLTEEFTPLISEVNASWSNYMKGELYRMKSWIYSKKRNYKRSIEFSEAYLNIIKEYYSSNSRRFYQAYLSLFSANKAIGNYNLANKYIEKAFQFGESSEDIEIQVYTLFQKGINSQKLGDFTSAKLQYKKLLEYESFNSTFEIYKIQSLYRLADILYQENKASESLQYLNLSITLTQNIYGSNHVALLPFYNLKLKNLLRNRDMDSADSLIKKTLSIYNFDNISKSLFKKNFINSLNEYLINNDFLDSAEMFLSKIIIKPGEISTNKVSINSLVNKANYYLKRYDVKKNIKYLDSSMFHYKLYFEELLYQKNEFKVPEDRIYTNNQKKVVLDKAFYVLYLLYESTNEMKYLELALKISEYLKAGQLSEYLNRSYATKVSGIPDTLTWLINDLKQQESYLLSQISQIQKKSNKSSLDLNKLESIKSELITNNSSNLKLTRYIEEKFNKFYNLTYNIDLFDSRMVQSSIDQNDILIEYSIAGDNIFAFIFTKNNVTFKNLGSLKNERIVNFLKLIKNNDLLKIDDSDYLKFSNQSFILFNKLLKTPFKSSIKRLDKIDKLYIVPDKILNYLPFELLIQSKPEGSIVNYRKLDFLIKDYSVSYGNSSTLLFKNLKETKERRGIDKVLAIAPSYTSILSDEAQLSKLGKFRDGFEELKYNKVEVDAIGKYFDGRILKNDEATEEEFIKNYKDYDILHFAMHALVDDEDSDNSKLIFTPQNDSSYDSYLHSFELYNMQIKPRLAVLSACNTGDGELKNGEGVMSLARAFTYAGAESVVMSHWPVNDKSSSIIMQYFYKHLSEGKAKDQALRLAKLEFLESAQPAELHPFHWNNFVVYGDVSPLTNKNKWYLSLWFYATIIILTMVIVILLKNKKLS